MSDSVRPHRRQPTRLPRPWDSPGKNTGVGCHFLLQYMKGWHFTEGERLLGYHSWPQGLDWVTVPARFPSYPMKTDAVLPPVTSEIMYLPQKTVSCPSGKTDVYGTWHKVRAKSMLVKLNWPLYALCHHIQFFLIKYMSVSLLNCLWYSPTQNVGFSKLFR